MEHLGFKVRVSCTTFNHAPYIVDAMNGFTMQQTTFPFVCIIIDDASTDGEPEIIKTYLDENFDLDDKAIVRNEETENYRLFFARHKTNLNCYFVVLFLKYNHYSVRKPRMSYVKEFTDTKYIAICEGDDYWIYPLKLQNQVDFMESHPDYGMCHTDFTLHGGSNRTHYYEHYPDGNYFPGILLYEDAGIGTLTVLIRKETFDKTPKYYQKEHFVASDKAQWIELAKEAKIKYLPKVTGCYRILPNSASHSLSFEKNIAFREELQYIRRFYAEKYNITLEDFNNYYTNLLKVCYLHSKRDMAEKYYLEAKSCNSVNRRGYIYYLGTKFKLLHWFFEKLK